MTISLFKRHHGHDLAEDLSIIDGQLRQRRKALSWIASAAASSLLLEACGGGGSEDSAATSTSTTTSGSTGTSTSTSGGSTSTGSTPTTTTTTTTTGSCVADPQETAGPYPADGTNSASGSTSDVLTASGIVRSDIRPSFISSTTVAQGVLVTITLTVVNTNASCAALAGYAVYLWHCDRSGSYSLYSVPTESYLRGVQVTDANGQVTFTTIFPACYSGRYPHMHFEVFKSLAVATTGKNAVLTSQLAMPSAVCTAVYPTVSGYTQSVSNFAAVSLASDNVFGDNSSAQITAMTPTMTGSASAGYTATVTVGVAV